MDQEQEIVELEIDGTLLEQVEELIRPLGITMEDLIVAFYYWCAKHPEEATAYLKKAMEEQHGTVSQDNP